MKNYLFVFVAFLSTACLAQTEPRLPDVLIPIDPASIGYTVDNNELKFKEQVALPRNISLEYRTGMIDERHMLANLVADEKANYEKLEEPKKIIIIDTQTGAIKPAPYAGTIECFVDGNLAISNYRGVPRSEATFSYGKYGEVLKTWKGGRPKEFFLNERSCTLHKLEDLHRIKPPEGMEPALNLARLRAEHGVIGGFTYKAKPSADTSGFSPELQKLMSQPFMQNMTVASHVKRFIFRKTNGEEMIIPTNSIEAIDDRSVAYLPWLNAYFLNTLGSLGTPKDLEATVPRFLRVLYPDGQIKLFGFPDVIREPAQSGEISYGAAYTKIGIIWGVKYIQDPAHRVLYKSDLKEGVYLDNRETKTLKKINGLIPFSYYSANGSVSYDGCKIASRSTTTSTGSIFTKGWPLWTNYFIDLCTGAQK